VRGEEVPVRPAYVPLTVYCPVASSSVTSADPMPGEDTGGTTAPPPSFTENLCFSSAEAVEARTNTARQERRWAGILWVFIACLPVVGRSSGTRGILS